jgi:hypothetical protein
MPDPSTYEDAERFQKLFIAPLIDVVKSEIAVQFGEVKQHIADTNAKADAAEKLATALDARVKTLEGSRNKLMIVYGVLVMAGSVVWNLVQRKIGQWFFRSS